MNILKTDMVEEASLEFRLRKIDETKYYLLDEIKHNDLTSEKYKKACTEANSGLVKLVVMTNVFFINQPHEIKTNRFVCVKQIVSSVTTEFNVSIHSVCKT